MPDRQDLPPGLRRRFQTGRICLDFTHTGGEGDYARWELLNRPADAARFFGIILGTEPPTVRSRDMTTIRRLRTAITIMALSATSDAAPPSDALRVVNAVATQPSLVPQFSDAGERRVLRGTANQVCSSIARDTIDLFASPLRERIRICEAPDCALLFVDTSRPGKRRWCSMEWCGDRQKKRRAGRPIRQEVADD